MNIINEAITECLMLSLLMLGAQCIVGDGTRWEESLVRCKYGNVFMTNCTEANTEFLLM